MSGHSKWANIKHKKEKTDAQRGKIFTKIGRELSIAVRSGGPDPAVNTKLADVIAKGIGATDMNAYEEIVYEGYGPAGVAVILEILTDNRNRTAGEMRHIFDKAGGSMGATGCVGWMFDKKGVIVIERTPDVDEDELTMQALEAGAEDITSEEDAFEIYTSPEEFSNVRKALEDAGYAFLSAEIDRIPQTTVTVDEEALKKVNWMLDMFEDNDDVQNVFHNALLPEEE